MVKIAIAHSHYDSDTERRRPSSEPDFAERMPGKVLDEIFHKGLVVNSVKPSSAIKAQISQTEIVDEVAKCING